MRDTFGEADIAALASQNFEQLKGQLEAYGSGGTLNEE